MSVSRRRLKVSGSASIGMSSSVGNRSDCSSATHFCSLPF
jgi:hypothetical protein